MPRRMKLFEETQARTHARTHASTNEQAYASWHANLYLHINTDTGTVNSRFCLATARIDKRQHGTQCTAV